MDIDPTTDEEFTNLLNTYETGGWFVADVINHNDLPKEIDDERR